LVMYLFDTISHHIINKYYKWCSFKTVFPKHPYFWGSPNGWSRIVVREGGKLSMGVSWATPSFSVRVKTTKEPYFKHVQSHGLNTHQVVSRTTREQVRKEGKIEFLSHKLIKWKIVKLISVNLFPSLLY